MILPSSCLRERVTGYKSSLKKGRKMAQPRPYRFECPTCSKIKTGRVLHGTSVVIKCCGVRHEVPLLAIHTVNPGNDQSWVRDRVEKGHQDEGR